MPFMYDPSVDGLLGPFSEEPSSEETSSEEPSPNPDQTPDPPWTEQEESPAIDFCERISPLLELVRTVRQTLRSRMDDAIWHICPFQWAVEQQPHDSPNEDEHDDHLVMANHLEIMYELGEFFINANIHRRELMNRIFSGRATNPYAYDDVAKQSIENLERCLRRLPDLTPDMIEPYTDFVNQLDYRTA